MIVQKKREEEVSTTFRKEPFVTIRQTDWQEERKKNAYVAV